MISAVKYGLIVIGGIAAFVSIRRLLRAHATVRYDTLGALSHDWLVRQRSDEQ